VPERGHTPSVPSPYGTPTCTLGTTADFATVTGASGSTINIRAALSHAHWGSTSSGGANICRVDVTWPLDFIYGLLMEALFDQLVHPWCPKCRDWREFSHVHSRMQKFPHPPKVRPLALELNRWPKGSAT
jgi:hypothetical protein